MARRQTLALSPEERRGFLGLSAAATCGTVAYHLLIGNFLALFANQMGFSPALIGLLYLSVQAPAIFQVLVARYVDRHGGKRPALMGFLCSPVALLFLIFSPQVTAWGGHWAGVASVFLGVVAYTVSNLTVGASWMPLLRVNLPEGRLAELIGGINRVAMLIGLGATLGASFWLGEGPKLWHFQALFIVGAILAGARGILFRHVRDVTPQPDAPSEPIWQGLGALWDDVRFRRLITFTVLGFVAGGLVGPFRPLYMKALGFSDRFAAIVTVSLVLGVYGVMSPVWGALTDRYGSRGAYVIGGIGCMAGHLVLCLATGHTRVDAALLVLSLFLGAAFWGGFDFGNIKRLFSLVPRERQSLYMTVYMITSSFSVAFGSFLGGLIVKLVRWASPDLPGAIGFERLLDYRVLFLTAAAGMVVAIGYSRRMMALEEITTGRLLVYLRLRMQRTLMTGFPGIIRKRVPSEELPPK